MMNKWVIRKKKGNVKLLCETIGVSEITAQILINRGFLKEDTIDDFLNTDITRLKDFAKCYGVSDAIQLLETSIKNKEKITIYGDYDVDGVTSTTILYKTIKLLTNNVDYFLPNRHKDGYGLSIENIDIIANNGTNLILTCDNGIASQKENDYIAKKGIKQIVIDHHEEPYTLDENLIKPSAIIDPKQSKCNYVFKEMCAAGLSYRFSVLLLDKFNIGNNIKDELLVFAMIGTICDIVPLSGDNRILVKEGLKILNSDKYINSGIRNILYKKDVLDKEITPYTIGFIVGPTINSAGRLNEASLAVKLFTSYNENEIDEISSLLYELNKQRQDMTRDITKKTIEQVDNGSYGNDKILIIYSKNCNEAVAGIVSGRIKEKYNKPTILVTGDNSIYKGSCRSITKYNMYTELSKVSNYFTKFGGHKMAAGFSIAKENFNDFKNDLLSLCSLTDEDLVKVIAVDDILDLSKINYKEAENLEILKPYGENNKEPLFASLRVKVKSIKIYEEKNTLILEVCDYNEQVTIKAITFSLLDKFKQIIESNFEPFVVNKLLNGIIRDIDLILDIVYYIDINEFKGKRSVQLKIEDLRISSN